MSSYGPKEQAVITAMENGTTAKRVVYLEDHESFGKFILSPQVRKPVTEVAHAIAATAAGLAHRHTGRMAGSYHVVQAGSIKVDRAFRVRVDVINDDGAAASEEFGNSHVGRPGHRPLGRAGSIFGDFHGGLKEPG